MLVRIAVTLAIATLLPGRARSAPANAILQVSFEGKPLQHLRVDYFNGETTLRGTTNKKGVVMFALGDNFSEWNLSSGTTDYVFRNLRAAEGRWHVDAVHSATWIQRSHPRPCDAWALVRDIPRGSLRMESAVDYEEWYSSLTPQLIENCVVLARIEKRVGSRAPWYFYELLARPRACVDGKYVMEEDWTAWYRSLLEDATRASPGKCVSDWQRWWEAKGYERVPEQPVEPD